jgi:hypothetical protein
MIHLCRTPAKAEVGDWWRCDCGREWYFTIDFGQRSPEWTASVEAGVR